MGVDIKLVVLCIILFLVALFVVRARHKNRKTVVKNMDKIITLEETKKPD
jgi:cell division protein FtsL